MKALDKSEDSVFNVSLGFLSRSTRRKAQGSRKIVDWKTVLSLKPFGLSLVADGMEMVCRRPPSI